MKLIEGLKKIKDLQRKAEDIRTLIGTHSAYLSHETPKYADQRSKVGKWLQVHSDLLKEILKLRIAIQRTNLLTGVEIELEGKTLTKTIAEWIHRRRDLSQLEHTSWKMLTDRNLREGIMKQSTGEERECKLVRCYEPRVRDEKLMQYSEEPSKIDAKLEVVNAVTDLEESEKLRIC